MKDYVKYNYSVCKDFPYILYLVYKTPIAEMIEDDIIFFWNIWIVILS